MNKQIERATWENTIEEYNFEQDCRRNNLIVGIAVGVMITVCTVIYGLMCFIYG